MIPEDGVRRSLAVVAWRCPTRTEVVLAKTEGPWNNGVGVWKKNLLGGEEIAVRYTPVRRYD
jgi:hypothetical protein